MAERIMKHLSLFAAIVLSMTGLHSCAKNEPSASSKSITLKVNTIDTKSPTITNSNLDRFQIIAIADGGWHDNESNHDASDYDFTDTASKGSKGWGFEGRDHYWLNGVNIHFWSFSPVRSELDTAAEGLLSIKTPSAGENSLSFSYALPTPSSGSDASNQKDIVFAGNSETRTFNGSGALTSSSSRNDNNVDIVFYHPLSEIQFAVSPSDGSFDIEGLGIKAITIKNICGSGSCQFTIPSTFAWTPDTGDKNDYSQNCNTVFNSTSTAPTGWSKGNFTDSDSNTQTMFVYDNPFFMIPQTLSGANNLSVTFVKKSDGTEIQRDVTLNDTWLPSKYYKYKLSAKTLGQDVAFTAAIMDWEESRIEIN